MRQYRHLDARRIDIVERGAAIPDDAGRQLGKLGHGQQGQDAAHAEARYRDFAALPLQVVDGAADILIDGIAKVEAVHQVMGFFLFDGHLAPIQVWNQRQVACQGEAVGHAANLIVQAPPFLDDDNGRRAVELCRLREIALHLLSVGTGERHHGFVRVFHQIFLR